MSIDIAIQHAIVPIDLDTESLLDSTVRAWEPIWADADRPVLEVGAGWLRTVGRLAGALQRINPDLSIELVREEGASLNVRYRAPRDRAADLVIDMYTVVLQRTCDQCGKPGKLGERDGWRSARCDSHAPDRWQPVR